MRMGKSLHNVFEVLYRERGVQTAIKSIGRRLLHSFLVDKCAECKDKRSLQEIESMVLNLVEKLLVLLDVLRLHVCCHKCIILQNPCETLFEVIHPVLLLDEVLLQIARVQVVLVYPALHLEQLVFSVNHVVKLNDLLACLEAVQNRHVEV